MEGESLGGKCAGHAERAGNNVGGFVPVMRQVQLSEHERRHARVKGEQFGIEFLHVRFLFALHKLVGAVEKGMREFMGQQFALAGFTQPAIDIHRVSDPHRVDRQADDFATEQVGDSARAQIGGRMDAGVFVQVMDKRFNEVWTGGQAEHPFWLYFRTYVLFLTERKGGIARNRTIDTFVLSPFDLNICISNTILPKIRQNNSFF